MYKNKGQDVFSSAHLHLFPGDLLTEAESTFASHTHASNENGTGTCLHYMDITQMINIMQKSEWIFAKYINANRDISKKF